ncbi:MAG: histidinol dehydrogenase [Anaerolineae bacterium]
MSLPIRIVEGAAAARATILKREPLGQATATADTLAFLRRAFGRDLSPEEAVAEIIAAVRADGDAAVRRLTLAMDGVAVDELLVPEDVIERACASLEPRLVDALTLAAGRIRAFHERQRPISWLDWQPDGALGQMVRPLQRVGVYVPGGTAPLASTLLMAAVPARVAGVEEVIVATPPQRDGGWPHPVVLAAARIAGVDRVYRIGGAPAIAALALGTDSVPRVDKVVGPGRLLVVLAKKALYGVVGIESLPGPTETLLIADDGADPALVAADMLAQAEHVDASALLLTTSAALAERVRAQLEEQIGPLRGSPAEESLLRGGIAVVDSVEQALDLANEYAPEHLCLLLRDPWQWLPRVRNAGGVFLGELASEALGDYVVGPSHIMPTSGTARFASPVNVWDFMKITSVFAPGAADVAAISAAGAALAEAEGLLAHRDAILRRLSSEPRQ